MQHAAGPRDSPSSCPSSPGVVQAIIKKVVGVQEEYVLVATHPKGPVIPSVRAEQAAAVALQELTDEQFVPVVKAEAARPGRPPGGEMMVLSAFC